MNQKIKTKIPCFIAIFIIYSLCFASLDISPNEYVFKKIISGEIVNAIFILKNTNESDVHIERIKTSCGCTTVSKNSLVLKPGMEYKLNVRFDSNRFMGNIEKYVFIYLKGNKKYITLKIKGFVEKKMSGNLELFTNKIKYDITNDRKPYNKQIKIINNGTLKLRIRNIQHPSFISVKFEKIELDPEEQSKIIVEVLPFIFKKMQYYIKITTDSENNNEKWILINFK